MALNENWTEHTFSFPDGHTRYIEAGPQGGPLLIFIHGWIGVAELWKPQLNAFAALGFRTIAPDTRGYGGSTVSKNVHDYRTEQHVLDMLALIEHLGREKAVWIGHDWGAPLVWQFAAHYPDRCAAVCALCVPYRTAEFGIEYIASLSNRDIYPVAEYPLAQWDYMAFHNESPELSAKLLDADPENLMKMFFLSGSGAGHGQPHFFSAIRKNGGWFGGAEKPPSVDMSNTMLKDEPTMYNGLVNTIKKHGTYGPNAYYRNFDNNAAYAKTSKNDGILNMPVLFIGARWDYICETTTSRLCEPMRQFCTDLVETTIDSGHWVNLEKPTETNASIARWLATRVKEFWPGYWSTPMVSSDPTKKETHL